jgi:hypothetical protein
LKQAASTVIHSSAQTLSNFSIVINCIIAEKITYGYYFPKIKIQSRLSFFVTEVAIKAKIVKN